MTEWAAKVLDGVKRYSHNGVYGVMDEMKDGYWLHVDDAIAAIARIGATGGLVERLLDWAEFDEGKINDTREEAAAHIEALTAQVERLMGALEPFAKAADTWEPDDGDSHLGARIEHPHHGLERHAEFTFGDLRRARAALSATTEANHE